MEAFLFFATMQVSSALKNKEKIKTNIKRARQVVNAKITDLAQTSTNAGHYELPSM